MCGRVLVSLRNITFRVTQFSGSRVVYERTDMRTDEHGGRTLKQQMPISKVACILRT